MLLHTSSVIFAKNSLDLESLMSNQSIASLSPNGLSLGLEYLYQILKTSPTEVMMNTDAIYTTEHLFICLSTQWTQTSWFATC